MRFEDTVLKDRAVITIAGAGARGFLNTLVTADIAHLAVGQASYAALLTPQGKMLFDFFVVCEPERFHLDCAAEQADALVHCLIFYRLRAKIDIARDAGLTIAARCSGPGIADPRLAALGVREIGAEPDLPDDASSYHACRIALGVADTVRDLGSGVFFPHEANLDQLGGLSFTKGCYIGQEVVSRMQHRGTARSRIVPVRIQGGAPAKGTPVTAGDASLGELLSGTGDRALAFLRLDRLQDATHPPLAAGRPVEVVWPVWWKG